MTTKHVANTAIQNHVGRDDSKKTPLWEFLGIASLHLYFELDSLAKKERKLIKLRMNLNFYTSAMPIWGLETQPTYMKEVQQKMYKEAVSEEWSSAKYITPATLYISLI